MRKKLLRTRTNPAEIRNEGMHYHALATDYDGTLAVEGTVMPELIETLARFKNSGRKLVLVTGRILTELFTVFPDVPVFDRVVAENGGTLYNPITGVEEILAKAPPPELMTALEEQNVPITIGRVLIASVEPHDKTIVRVIRDLGLEHHIIFNKGSIMILPSGVNKATGLVAALHELGLSAETTVGVGDGENDHALLELCGYGVAVQNAVASLKTQAKWVTTFPSGAGVKELIERLLETDR
jgi:hydroxymethylpyrimidine pyrophosphatase-like HAD family hydrolase